MLRSILALLLLAAAPALAADSIFLVARKDMPDPNFRDTVVLVTKIAGSPIGVIVNRPTGIPLSGFFPEVENNARGEDKVHMGGPVQRHVVLFLFQGGPKPDDDDAIEVLDGVYLASNRTLLQEILSGERKVEALRVFLGYAGWSPDQLEDEVSRGDWHVSRPDARTIFEKSPARIWRELDARASLTPTRYAPR